jgi:hypothetical protein
MGDEPIFAGEWFSISAGGLNKRNRFGKRAGRFRYRLHSGMRFGISQRAATTSYRLHAGTRHMKITENMLSPFCRSLNLKYAFTEKLIDSLLPETKYKTHYRNLKLYLSLGMKLLRIHRVVAFQQKPWL